jgi:hypothetical protein
LALSVEKPNDCNRRNALRLLRATLAVATKSNKTFAALKNPLCYVGLARCLGVVAPMKAASIYRRTANIGQSGD